uniref:RNA helicase n=1 Tax=Physcomitrium patens TaxID=3218 RepID=A0A7I4A4A1_PHYPA
MEPWRERRGGGRGGGGRGTHHAGRRPVAEADRISIVDRLNQFKASNEEELIFEADLSNHDRAVVHDTCKKLGLKSKSRGKGDDRRVAVFKPSQRTGIKPASATPLTFSPASYEILADLFQRHPPVEDELLANKWEPPAITSTSSSAVSKKESNRHYNRGKASKQWTMNPGDVVRQAAALASRIQKQPALQKIAEKRSTLPIASFKDEITAVVDKHQVVLIAGETGCGKTTQVPQYILDHMWSQNKPCRIICTQPRRISATSVAERIAAERGENVGNTVGYQIRLESKGGRHSSLMFCTNGVLLRKLVGSGRLKLKENESVLDESEEFSGLDATHVIVDEIHERDRNADFLLIVLRDLLALKPNLRLILMSATLDADLFSSYFNNCPVVRVPGFTFPVQTYYLEDVLALTENQQSSNQNGRNSEKKLSLTEEDVQSMDEAIQLAWLEDDFETLMDTIEEFPRLNLCNYKHSLTGATALMVSAGKGRVEDVKLLLSLGADISAAANNGHTAFDWAKNNGQEEVVSILTEHMVKVQQAQFQAAETALLQNYQMSADQDEIDVALIERLLHRLHEAAGERLDTQGAVLVFLPGWEDISRLRECLQVSPIFGNPSRFLLLPLHSLVPSSEQRKVFQSPPSGVCKIVLATNIAETAITIDDIVYVIDTGRMKEKSYDPYSNVSTLQTVWISKASAKQREGRAGRCQPGVCYHLFSRLRMQALPEFQLPEIKRTPLEELCLQVKLYEPHGRIAEFILRALDPPLEIAVRNAVTLLQDIGALTSDELLTEMGKQLGSLPVHPSTSRMILLAILLNCLDPALTVACAAGFRDPFVLPLHPYQKKQAQHARQELAAMYGGSSDHLSIVAAFDRWENARVNGQESNFCSRYFVSGGTMFQLAGMRQQLQGELVQKGFIKMEPHPCSLNARDPGIVRAVLAAGMYPMVGNLLPPLPGSAKAIVQTARGEKVRIHPHSISIQPNELASMDQTKLNQLLVVFDEVTRGEAQVYVRKCTLITPHPLILLSTEMVKERPSREVPAQHRLMSSADALVSVVVDRRFYFSSTALDGAQLFVLRSRMNAALNFKVTQPRLYLPAVLADSVHAIACILSFDAMPAMALPSTSHRGSSRSRGAHHRF